MYGRSPHRLYMGIRFPGLTFNFATGETQFGVLPLHNSALIASSPFSSPFSFILSVEPHDGKVEY